MKRARLSEIIKPVDFPSLNNYLIWLLTRKFPTHHPVSPPSFHYCSPTTRQSKTDTLGCTEHFAVSKSNCCSKVLWSRRNHQSHHLSCIAAKCHHFRHGSSSLFRCRSNIFSASELQKVTQIITTHNGVQWITYQQQRLQSAVKQISAASCFWYFIQ